DREDGRAAGVLLLPFAAQERHADEMRSARSVPYHGAVARLEDMERERHAREEDDVGEREDGDDLGQRHDAMLVRQLRQRPVSTYACAVTRCPAWRAARSPVVGRRGVR